jgi:hypothetical protein
MTVHVTKARRDGLVFVVPHTRPYGAEAGVVRHESSLRLNHRLPRRETHTKVMQRTADFHDQIADARLPEAAGVMNDAAALDAAIDVLNAHATTGDTPIRRFLCAREGPAPRLPGRHDDLHVVERERQEAEILEQPAARGQGVGCGIGHPLIVGAAGRGLTQK